MDRKAVATDHHNTRPLITMVLSLLCALAGLALAAIAEARDNALWVLAGMALGVLGPVSIALVARAD
ncbi:hypothetical protein ORI20_18810 [Mycobacterium sp. CVI_P3]|uniref:Transmembrane protein n=1 Tax=Mycobacterium pinniadriaticum TaxID=2994102 RepID=A0ABT3SHH2_9MYCO|nr:hypothetical protein [Mycobacterium pinniadriaticum]MCX2932326.1 hypothetical protein [Mycobacterium pinniadriaticum]MCX2938817.1 hypothetical protein [Mycobacterium pinniadriaticum]